ncbi:amylo-alpha-1,6-glucosidase [Saccharopolyspora erythraea NRRL 2338]|uniref:Amylo-alpha-1,6-glucosidase n=2 Tax=Saccharopolyspora erythraea TaxID=1836 RepID=A4FII4_SACEN|nr:glycogen debranching N-terminal domain-containing protein [Saccharopolyspora erythraea]PFG97535.1 amylo-alpha-1,6-glucosidase [Saccharopolyspora erythraea NRRL 2338]QRK87708.1 amylo-alpha-1,6-glucosidase [Saccharopolyspora erythraea]CAM03859.1 amylo-alpha-1,6-glucosidase [Saccharopolyspora erythraea NRRL 2338]
MPDGQQPALHDLVTVLCAPSVAISAPDGQIRAGGASGFYRHDRRGLALLEIGVEGAELVPTGANAPEAGRACFHGVLRGQGEANPDPVLHYRRERRAGGESFAETWTLCNHSSRDADLVVTARVATDLARMDLVKAGAPGALAEPEATGDGVRWQGDGCAVDLAASRTADDVSIEDNQVRLSWRVEFPAGAQWSLSFALHQHEQEQSGFLPQRPARPVRLVAPRAGEGDHARLLERSLQDLDGLLLADPRQPESAFLAAGSPWFFTLFGRDSLWAARFLLPLGTELAGGTLRVLAALQGTRHDPATEEQPGKIPHELRRAAIDIDGSEPLRLPPLYYGTVDATPLWVCLLHDAWRAGLPEDEVRALLPTLTAALGWLSGPGDPDGDGFCEYQGSDADGLANQGWKDSGDGIRWSDGGIARRPLALCEVQGYAYAAAVGGADLLDAFGGDGGPARQWGAELRARFREQFWVEDEHGRYPAVALDGDKRPVTGPTSNMAHLLGTGLLDAHEARLVADQLTSSALDSGYGLRTLASTNAGFNPLSYHCGSVWPHDTAIAVLGLAAEGLHEQARVLAEGLVRSAVEFGHRVPELHGGTDRAAGEPVVAYPASCRPQAWSAAGAVAVVGYLEGWNRAAKPGAQPGRNA